MPTTYRKPHITRVEGMWYLLSDRSADAVKLALASKTLYPIYVINKFYYDCAKEEIRRPGLR